MYAITIKNRIENLLTYFEEMYAIFKDIIKVLEYCNMNDCIINC